MARYRTFLVPDVKILMDESPFAVDTHYMLSSLQAVFFVLLPLPRALLHSQDCSRNQHRSSSSCRRLFLHYCAQRQVRLQNHGCGLPLHPRYPGCPCTIASATTLEIDWCRANIRNSLSSGNSMLCVRCRSSGSRRRSSVGGVG